MNLPRPTVPASDGQTAVEIAGELRRTLAKSVDWTVREWRAQLAAVEKKQAGYAPSAEQRDDLAALREFTRSAIDSFERIGQGEPSRLDHVTPDELSWYDITDAMACDEQAGWELWRRVRQTARRELAAGVTAERAVAGYHPRPYERAQYLAIREALADGLQPRNAMEWALIDAMAQAWTMQQRWLEKAVKLDSLDALRIERDVRQRDAWEPPKLCEAEAIDRATLMAGRYERTFLRLMKCLRDGRRLGVSMTVHGEQVNVAVAEQQVVANVMPDGK